jgi:hypothetical protein
MEMENGPTTMASELLQEFKVQILEMPAGDSPEDGVVRCLALVVLRRLRGLLLCVPSGYFNEDVLAAGLMAGVEDQIGQSIALSLPAGSLQDVEVFGQPVPSPGQSVDVVLVDVSLDIGDHLKPFNPVEPLAEGLVTFDSFDPLSFPVTDALVNAAWRWVLDPGSGERAAFYSAQEEEEEAEPASPSYAPLPPRPRAKAAPGTGRGEGPQKETQKKRPTVATLSASLEELSGSIPALLQEVRNLSDRTAAMEQQMAVGGRPSALRQPLGSLATPGLSQPSVKFADLLQEMPPPRNTSSRSPQKQATATPAAKAQAQELEEEMEHMDTNASLTQAVMIQSKALSSLVATLASGESMMDLSASSSGFSSRGAQGRIKLQQELAQHRGTFFNSIFSAMSRRMQLARVAEVSPAELAQRGVTATQYVERYGGYGRCRDMGNIMWQVALALDHLQNDNVGAAKDAIALLAVCLEQTSLDAGRMDVGLLLSLTEDPPSGVFTNRTLPSHSRGRAFAPLADQRWVANALSYIKELDTIATKRSDVTGKPSNKEGKPDSQADPKKAPKKTARPWKKKNQGGSDAGGAREVKCIAVRSLPFAIERQPACAQLTMMVANQNQIFGNNKSLHIFNDTKWDRYYN